MNLDCCPIIGNPSLTLANDLVVLDRGKIAESDSRLLAVGDEGVVDDNVVGGGELGVKCGYLYSYCDDESPECKVLLRC